MNSKRLNLKIGSMIIGVIFAYVINWYGYLNR
jgi:hypothetical protein